MGAGAALMLIGANLGILYALVAVLAVFAVIAVVVAPVLGIVVFVGTCCWDCRGSSPGTAA
jgi:hypothetical protein